MVKVIVASVGLSVLLCTAGCRTPAGSFCDLAKPIRLTPEQIATLSDAQVSAFLGHNRRGEAQCGWRR